MTADFSPKKDVLLERPAEIDDGTLLRIRQIRPVDRAAGPLIDLNLYLIDLVRKYRPWYRGAGSRPPRELLSTIINPNENEFGSMLKNFLETVKKFKPGAFPGHCFSVRALEFTTVQLMRELQKVVREDALFVGAIRCVGNMSAALADPSNVLLNDHDLFQRIDSRMKQLVAAFADISEALRKFERELDLAFAFRKLPHEPVTKEDVAEIKETAAKTERKVDIVIAKQEETRKTVNRIDQRDKKAKKGKRLRFSVEKQELAFDYWERGRKMTSVKQLAPNGHKPGHEHVYAYFKNELQSLGFKKAEEFDACLGCRSDRIQRNKRK